jgi:ABC-type nitrate/sulfonate/bicarbonate transport system permease component
LFLWDLVYFLGITDNDHLPHPFRIFRLIGDSDLFRGFRGMLRQMIFWIVPGSLVGVAAAYSVLHSRRLTEAMLRFLRLGIWLPFPLLFMRSYRAVWWGIATAMLCGSYYYLVARQLLSLNGREVLRYVGRETILQLFLFTLLAQLWLGYWQWPAYWALFEPRVGFQVLAMMAIFIAFINWVFHSDFEGAARTREIVLSRQLESANRSSLLGAIIIAIVCLLILQGYASLWFYRSYVSPTPPVSTLDGLRAARDLFGGSEIWRDIQVSLVEISLGLVLSCFMALIVAMLCVSNILRSVLFFFLPLTFISSLAAYLLTFVLVFLYVGNLGLGLWHKILAVGCLTFFPYFQTWWALRNQPKLYRVLLALDDALPFAFIAMLFGEVMASTAGLGFMMLAADWQFEWDKALAGLLITAGLFVSLSAGLRGIARLLYPPAPAANAMPAQAA